MSPKPESPIRLAIDVADAELAARIAACLAGVEGLELITGDSDTADAVIIAPGEDVEPAAAGLKLTPRELEVLALLAEGASNRQIAQRLSISTHTAKFHVGRVLDKLDAVSRTDAVAHAARLRVINL